MDELPSLQRILLIDELGKALAQHVSAGLAAHGFAEIRPARWFALATIANRQPSTAVLARWLGITRQSASELVEFALHEGYAVRLPERGSRRARPVRLTAKGESLVLTAEGIAAEAIYRWSGARPAEPPDGVFQFLRRMVQFQRWHHQTAAGRTTAPFAAPGHQHRLRSTGAVDRSP